MNKGLKIALIVAGVFILLIGGITAFAMLSAESSKNNEQNRVKSTGSADEIRYNLKLNNQLPLPANADQDIKFNILNQTGEVQKDFVVKDTKLAYVYFLRTDINKLIVVNPEFNKETGEFTIKKFNFGPDSNYRMLVSFKARQMRDTFFEQHETVLRTDVTVGNKALYKVEAFGDVRSSEIVDGVTVNIDGWREGKALSRDLTMNFNKDGQVFKGIKSFNGSPARIYAFKQGSMDFALVNTEQITYDSATGNIKFNILFPKEGIYKLFVELNINDKPQTATFVLDLKDLK